MKNTLFFIFFSIGLFISFSAFALTPEQVLRMQEMIRQQQNQDFQADKDRLLLDEAEKIRKSRENEGILPSKDTGTLKKPPKGQEKLDSSTACSVFEKIVVVGQNIFSQETLEKRFLNKYLGQCINRDNMTAIQKELTSFYIDQGYTLARVYFDMKKMLVAEGKGTLFIVIEEGNVRSLRLIQEIDGDENTPPQSSQNSSGLRRQKLFAFPFLEESVFNLKDFEQGLDQMNRLQSNNATMDISPADDLSGASDVIILNKRTPRTTFFSFSADNSGDKSTGENTGSISINQDNLLNMNDNIYLKLTDDLMFDRQQKYNESLYSAMSIPLGYWTFSGSFAASKYKSTVEGLYTDFSLEGSSQTSSLTLDKVLYRTNFFKTALGLNLEYKRTESYIRDVKSQVGSRDTSSLGISWNNTFYTTYGIVILRPGYRQGLSLFGVREDEKDLPKNAPKFQYQVFQLYGYYSSRWNIPTLTETTESGETIQKSLPIFYTLQADSQYALNALYSVNRFSVGGQYTVRGFNESNISGDNGFYIRNDVTVSLSDVFPFSSNWIKEPLSKTRFGVFYDYGYVRNRSKDLADLYNAIRGIMRGSGVSLTFSGDILSWSLTYAKALSNPRYLQTRDDITKERESIYWRATLSW